MNFDLRTGKTKTFPISRHSQASTLYDVLNLKRSQFRGTTEPETFFNSLDRQNPGRFGIGPDGNWVLTRHGRRKNFSFHDGEPRNILLDEQTNRVWFNDWQHVSGSGTWISLYDLEWSKGRPVRVFKNASEFDFSPHRKLYAAVENFHLPPNAKKRRPEFARAWVGNWMTGQRWWITGANVNATNIALLPAR